MFCFLTTGIDHLIRICLHKLLHILLVVEKLCDVALLAVIGQLLVHLHGKHKLFMI